MNQSIDHRFAAFVGIDWADAKHDICLLSAGLDRPRSCLIAHSPEAIEAWALGLQERFAGQPIAVCLELSKGPLVNALCKYDFFVLFPVNPQSLARYRRVGDKVRITNRLTSTLKSYFPQVLQWFNDKDTTLFCDLLDRWPTLQAAQKARRATLERFFTSDTTCAIPRSLRPASGRSNRPSH